MANFTPAGGQSFNQKYPPVNQSKVTPINQSRVASSTAPVIPKVTTPVATKAPATPWFNPNGSLNFGKVGGAITGAVDSVADAAYGVAKGIQYNFNNPGPALTLSGQPIPPFVEPPNLMGNYIGANSKPAAPVATTLPAAKPPVAPAVPAKPAPKNTSTMKMAGTNTPPAPNLALAQLQQENAN